MKLNSPNDLRLIRKSQRDSKTVIKNMTAVEEARGGWPELSPGGSARTPVFQHHGEQLLRIPIILDEAEPF